MFYPLNYRGKTRAAGGEDTFLLFQVPSARFQVCPARASTKHRKATVSDERRGVPGPTFQIPGFPYRPDSPIVYASSGTLGMRVTLKL